MKEKMKELIQQIKDADMILIGIGEEFDNIKELKQNSDYKKCREMLEDSDKQWVIPALNLIYEREQNEIYNVLNCFANLIAEKNYFVVSVSTNEVIREVSWREKRLVMPCGGSSMKQCENNCGHALSEMTEFDWNAIKSFTSSLIKNDKTADFSIDLGSCPKCGSPLVLNSIYTSHYDENGYLDQWQLYTKWLQGTLNRKLLVIELGVGMQCPSVIRWPFEKVAFFNQKASFWRINEKLYQLSEDLKGKATSISMNAIDWLRFLC